IGAMMFAEAEKAQPELIGQLDFLQQIRQPLGRALQRVAIQRIGGIFSERIKSEFHLEVSWLSDRWRSPPERSRTHSGVTAPPPAMRTLLPEGEWDNGASGSGAFSPAARWISATRAGASLSLPARTSR